VAELLARRLGVPLKTVVPPKNRVAAEMRKNCVTEYQSLSHSWGLGLAAATNDASILFDGMNGGALFGRSSVVRLARSRFGDVLPDWDDLKRSAVQHLFEKPAAALRGFLVPEILNVENLEIAKELLEGSLDKYADYPNPLQAWRYYNHVARDSSAFAYELMQARAVVCPLDRPDLVTWALSLPWNISSDSTFQTSAIRRHFPESADVPFEDEFRPSGRGYDVDRITELASTRFLLNRPGKPVVTEQGTQLLLSGEASLRQLQVFVYLSQLMGALESGSTEGLFDSAPA
jgi:hypothetical protein